jgi:hypothetical protein
MGVGEGEIFMKPNNFARTLGARRHRALGVPPRVVLVLGALLPLVTICPPPSTADDPEVLHIMRVEQDWEVVLNQPDEGVDAPQFHTVISPFAELDSLYLQICWNYREQPQFMPGGLQLIAWNGEYYAGTRNCREDKFSTTAETITWTQAMETTGSTLTLEIKNGSSTTWGSFGGPETSLSGAVCVPNLNDYRTGTSVSNSWISYGANRVNVLRITEVRRYDEEGNLVFHDQTPRVVYELGQ